MTEANNGAPSPDGFAQDAGQLARLIQRDASIRLGFMALGGWDTHVNEGAIKGQLANHLQQLGDGLASFTQQLGSAYDDTIILVISEFGRTMHENGNGGTDHGHGNVMWVMGGPVRGGHVYGRWPGLATGELYQERDLAVTTDFREPISAVLRCHLGLSPTRSLRSFRTAPPTPATRPASCECEHGAMSKRKPCSLANVYGSTLSASCSRKLCAALLSPDLGCAVSRLGSVGVASVASFTRSGAKVLGARRNWCGVFWKSLLESLFSRGKIGERLTAYI